LLEPLNDSVGEPSEPLAGADNQREDLKTLSNIRLQPTDPSSGQFVNRADDQDVLLFPIGPLHLRRAIQLVHRPADIGFNASLKEPCRSLCRVNPPDSRTDECDKPANPLRMFGAGEPGRQRSLHRAAVFMPEYDHEFGAEVLMCILDAAGDIRRDDVASDPDHEQVAETLIEDQFRRHARIAATQDDGEGVLAAAQSRESLLGDVAVFCFATDESLISFDQALKRLLRRVWSHCAGIVIRGSFSGLPVSDNVKKKMMTESVRLVCKSPLSTQNQ